MSEGFVPLARFLRPPPPEPAVALTSSRSRSRSVDRTCSHSEESFAQFAATFSAIRRFRAALGDALDVAVQQLLAEIAENVLARELRSPAPTLRPSLQRRASDSRASESSACAFIRETVARWTASRSTRWSTRNARARRGDRRASQWDHRFRLRARLESALAACAP